MGQTNSTTESRKGKHLNYADRLKIEALSKIGVKPSVIGEQLQGRSRRTIERELARGMVSQITSELITYQAYSADVGQQVYDRNGTAKGPALKIGHDHEFVSYMEESILSGLSPYATLQNVINNPELNFKTSISVKTFYNYLDAGLFMRISNKDLLVKKSKKKRNYHHIRTAITNVKGTSIADRPVEIDSREEVGHWEMDTVVGKQGTKTTLLVLSERSLRKELIFKLTGKTQAEVTRVLNGLERIMGRVAFAEKFKSITTDNGCEFLDFESIEKSLFSKNKARTKMYYAHPYSSWERGTNENINKMIRRFIPKGVDIAKYSKKEIKRIEHWINNYPRKILAGLSANMMEQKYAII